MIECKCGTPHIFYNEKEQPIMMLVPLQHSGATIKKIKYCPFCGDRVVPKDPDYTAMAVEYVKGLLISDKEAFEDNYDFVERWYKEQYHEFDMDKYCFTIEYLIDDIRKMLNERLEGKK